MFERIRNYFFPPEDDSQVHSIEPRQASAEAGRIAQQLAEQIGRDEGVNLPPIPVDSSCQILEVDSDFSLPGFGTVPPQVQEMGGVGVAVFFIRPENV